MWSFGSAWPKEYVSTEFNANKESCQQLLGKLRSDRLTQRQMGKQYAWNNSIWEHKNIFWNVFVFQCSHCIQHNLSLASRHFYTWMRPKWRALFATQSITTQTISSNPRLWIKSLVLYHLYYMRWKILSWKNRNVKKKENSCRGIQWKWKLKGPTLSFLVKNASQKTPKTYFLLQHIGDSLHFKQFNLALVQFLWHAAVQCMYCVIEWGFVTSHHQYWTSTTEVYKRLINNWTLTLLHL